ncbi:MULTISPECIES: Gfo/Idh/MocA family protein [unclassified Brevundimonas]|uniref:Gfo/Idh/MocA family protein n=1 Tax=unclassified Brevundimonas TaxID=2622653 RepID=UPI000CFA9898|nr:MULTISPECIES: Gfo/Idh/MocA family oxidoreductase [unclassified Brevundimonas]PRA36025.1 galactose 1-dehydrogenase [Brevundimonas sp. MYb27]PQZ84516.1 galactose 1-dehydrogenase [Brevundimonas sp. MYb31]PRB17751.1 galactose 1-dehydrogenase [Brevundimonas sp. MYb52]PRB38122.1 galactose 1-dehydrogenase [Brevundimonas sp. MYb46]PRB56096.1 galactose 1-dehydrogenase [Brevundimonas sp. MYb33]
MTAAPSSPVRLGLVGLGKISADEHVPAIRRDPGFALVGGVSPHSRMAEVRRFESLDALLEAGVDAVSINTPPQVRFSLAAQALRAGKHVLLEKPPGATVQEVEALRRLAMESGVTLFAAWHSQFAAGVAPAAEWLADRRITSVDVVWREDVRRWHPGQDWIWRPGGLGVFDPGVNALSILSRILPHPLVVTAARLSIPGNRQTPIAASLTGAAGDMTRWTADFDFLQTGVQTWTIEAATDLGRLTLEQGGAVLTIDGLNQNLAPVREYEAVYRRFAELIATRMSDVDLSPLALTADAFLIGEQSKAADFVE